MSRADNLTIDDYLFIDKQCRDRLVAEAVIGRIEKANPSLPARSPDRQKALLAYVKKAKRSERAVRKERERRLQLELASSNGDGVVQWLLGGRLPSPDSFIRGMALRQTINRLPPRAQAFLSVVARLTDRTNGHMPKNAWKQTCYSERTFQRHHDETRRLLEEQGWPYSR